MDEAQVDEDDGSEEQTAPPRGREPSRLAPWQVVLIWIAALVGPAALWFGGFALLGAQLDDTVPPGECEGVGFGCSLSERDGLWFVASVFGVPVVTIATAVTAALAAAVTARARRGGGWVVLLVVVVAVLVLTRRL